MEIKLNLETEYDAVILYQMLWTKRASYESERSKHIDMIELLEGNDKNEKAKSRLDGEKHSKRLNDEKIEFLDNLLNQLKPVVDKQFDR